MAEGSQFHNILTGNLDNIPPLPKTTVKIYICSNPGEFDIERRYIWNEVLPNVQHHCLQLGLDVMFVDMLLGDQKDPLLDNNNHGIRLKELEICAEESIGSFFLALVGEYGNVPAPKFIEEIEFKRICDALSNKGKKVDLLTSWYNKDSNAIPVHYRLRQPKPDEMEENTVWLSTQRELVHMIQSAGIYGRDLRHSERFQSVLEKEIKTALKISSDGCIFVFRNIQTLESELLNGTENSGHVKQSMDKTIKPDVSHGLYPSIEKLKKDIESIISDSNILYLNFKLTEDCLIQNNKRTPDDNVENVIAAITTKINELVDKSVATIRSIPETPFKSYNCVESLIHLHHCAKLYRETPLGGCEKTFTKLQSMLINGSRAEHQLCILKCTNSCSKARMMAKICYRAKELFGRDAIIIPIFVGLTTRSCIIEDIFRRICVQINLILKQELDIETYSLQKLTSFFHGLTNRVSKSMKQLLIVIDSLENLQITSSPTFDTSQVDWLAAKLPPKFHLIVSCTSNENLQIIKRLESKLLNPDIIVYIGKMTSDECRNVLYNNLAKHKRKLTNEQYLTVVEALSEGHCPFMVEAISNCVCKWSSDDKPSEQTACSLPLPITIEHLLNSKLDHLEDVFGKTVIGAVCKYITLSRFGLTEIELLDCLSSNDGVLVSIYEKSVPDVLRFPGQAWAIIKDELGALLARRHIYGRTLLRWGYKCCSIIARQRYLADTDVIISIHTDIADLFLEVWKTNNPFLGQEENEMCQEDMDRLLCPQPLVYSDTKYNTRRLQELWYHLMKAGDIARFKEHTFCSFEYLLALADADHIQRVFNNIEIIRSLLVDSDIHLLNRTIQSSGVGLHSSPLQLANEIIGRMRQIKDYFPLYIEPLVSQCMEWCDSYNHPILVPLTTWLDNIHTPCVDTIANLPNLTCAELLPNGQHVLIGSGNKVLMYHIASKRLVKSFQGQMGIITCLCLTASRWSLASASKDKTVCIWDINSEMCKYTIRGFEAQVTCIVTTQRDDRLICGCEDGTIQVRDIIVGTTIKILEKHKKKVTAIKLCKSDTILISGAVDSKIFLFYTADWSIMNMINDEILSPITCLDVSQDCTFLMAGCDNCSLHVVAMATGSIAQTIQGHQGAANSIAICSDCHHCVVATSSGLVYLYNFRTTEVLDVYKGHNSAVLSALLTEDQQIAVTASKNEVFAWSLLKRFTKETYQDMHSGPVSCLTITSDGRRLISGSADGLLKSWNLDICDFADNFVGHTGAITCLAISSDHSFAISGSVDTTLKVWSLILATIITNYKGHERAVCGAYVLSDKRLVLSMEVAERVHLWRAEDGQTLRLYAGPTQLHTVTPNNVGWYAGHERAVCGAYVLSDKRLVLSMEVAERVHLWRAEDGQTLRLYAGPTQLHTVTPNSQICISGAGDQRLQIWSLTNGSIIKEVSHTDKITCLTCSSNSQYLVTGSIDRSVKVWELPTGKIVQIMVEHSSSVRCLAITDNNEIVLSGGEDGVILVCSLSLGCTEKKLSGHFDCVTVIRLSADNSIAVSGSVDNTVRVWNYRRGFQLTMLDTHYPVNDLAMTETGDRISVKLANNNHLPILCLHNTPSKTRAAVTISIETASTGTTKTRTRTVDSGLEISDSSESTQTLPIKPKPPLRPRVSVVFPLPTSRRRMSSLSSIPQIIQHSPIKAPIKTTVQAQEKRRIKFPGRNLTKPKNKPVGKEEKISSICVIL